MKNIKDKLIKIFLLGGCTPQISKIAKNIKEPSTTIHYNIKKMEKENLIRGYKAIINFKKINLGYTTYLFLDLNSEKYSDSELVLKELAKYTEIESIDICTGEYGIILKIRSESIEKYYLFIKKILKKYNFSKTLSVASLKEIKNNFDIDE
jgi:DNA-binding Lrp family transcriptional regulator